MRAAVPTLVVAALLLAPPMASAQPLAFASGVVPHHFVAEPLIAAFYRALADLGTPDTIVLVGPDHFKAASVTGSVLTTVAAEDGERLGIVGDEALLGKLRQRLPLATNALRVGADHAITVHLPFLQRHFPSAKVVPILIGHRATRAMMDELAAVLGAHDRGSRIAVVASVDFSHYLPKEAAAFHDVKSARVLLGNEPDAFPSLEVDSWQSLYLARRYAQAKHMEAPLLVGRANAADFVGHPAADSTTSYLSVIFVEAGRAPATAPPAHSVLLLGDLMLDRKVRQLMDERDERWPLDGVQRLLRGADLVFANLEGPIVRQKRIRNVPQRLGFAPSIAGLLAATNINLVSLANNHTLDQGEAALQETKGHLQRANVAFVGDPNRCGGGAAHARDGMLFLAFNLVGQRVCAVADLARTVQKARAGAPDQLIVVSAHWGSEYVKTHAWWQEELAHALIDAGADLVVGHHPHVVQDIELYRGRLIFYSLGNFVFDQYFMTETQVGLAVGMTISAQQGEWRLFPLRSQDSQPRLMVAAEAEAWLAKLAGASSPELAVGIRQGKIALERHP